VEKKEVAWKGGALEVERFFDFKNFVLRWI
jgi:hypothetical protein